MLPIRDFVNRLAVSLGAALVLLFASSALATEPQPPQFVFASYNVANYLRTDRRVEGRYEKSAMKPESEINAMIRIIKAINPDILGVCEMGKGEYFEDFKARLKAAGLGYASSELVHGPDEDRHLALLSRYPIVARHSLPEVSYELNGKIEKVRRGFLDVTVRVAKGCNVRLVGAHLKSKRDVSEGEALIRRHEAHLLRRHLEGIMTNHPAARLLVYGDFNDTKNEPAIQEIMGPRKSPMHLTDLWLKDWLGDRWTHYWQTADLYSRIDFIFVNDELRKDTVFSKCGIERSEDTLEASDHRALFATFRTGSSARAARESASP